MLYFKLDKIMDKKGLTINKVSSEANISRPALTAMYNNESKGAQFETLEKLMKYLDVNLSDLIGEKSSENIFAFRPSFNKEEISKIEKMNLKNRKDHFIEYKPSDYITFEGVLIEEEKTGEKFNFVIVPTFNEYDEIAILMVAFYRSDSQGNTFETKDIDSFFDKLTVGAIANILEAVFYDWLELYNSIDGVESKLSDILLFDIVVVHSKKRMAAVAQIDKKKRGSGVHINFEIFRSTRQDMGSKNYSNKLRVKQIPENIKIP